MNIILVTFPKPFEGESELLQANAMASWSLLEGVRVKVLGRETGIAEACARHGFEHVEDTEVNEYGTPMLDSAFKRVARENPGGIILFVNADIILDQTVVEALAGISRSRTRDYLVAGRRANLDISERLQPEAGDVRAVVEKALAAGDLAPAVSSDYFAFPAESRILEIMPRLIVGRRGWDIWMMYAARQCGVPLIDGTDFIHAIHPNHGYQHVPGKSDKAHLPWDGPESRAQMAIIGNRRLSLEYATHRFDKAGRVVPRKLSREERARDYRLRAQFSGSPLHRFRYKAMARLLDMVA